MDISIKESHLFSWDCLGYFKIYQTNDKGGVIYAKSGNYHFTGIENPVTFP